MGSWCAHAARNTINPLRLYFRRLSSLRFQVPRTLDAQALRKLDDEILLRGKHEGLTYEEILKKITRRRQPSPFLGQYMLVVAYCSADAGQNKSSAGQYAINVHHNAQAVKQV
jgi:hypothetical protein